MEEQTPVEQNHHWRHRAAIGGAVVGAVALATGVTWYLDSTNRHDQKPPADLRYLSSHDRAVATQVAHTELATLRGTFGSASVVLTANTDRSSNTGHSCTSDEILQVSLIGKWKNVNVSPDPMAPPPGPWEGAVYIVDRDSGQVCLVGVNAGPHVEPAPGSTILFGHAR